MAFGKRRGELLHVGGTDAARRVLGGYSLGVLNGLMFVCAGLSVVFYSFWALANREAMMYTVPLVIFIVCRYLVCIFGDKSLGDPVSVIFGDKVLIASAVAFGAVSLFVLYT
jgi:hypothetical protein